MARVTHLAIEDRPRAMTDTACGRFVHVTYASRHRVAVNCKACLLKEKPNAKRRRVRAIDIQDGRWK